MTNSAATAKLTLLEDRRGRTTVNGSSPVRRFRLARVRVDGPAPAPRERFEYLRRTHD
jgi:hypothetical protein